MNELSNVSNEMSFADLQGIINKAMAMQNEQLKNQMTELKKQQEMISKELEITKLEHDNLRELELKRHYTTEDRFGYVSANDLGQKFDVSIGSKTIGTLLRVVGLAKQKQSKTEPLRTAVVNGYAKSILYGDFPTYQWNPEKCIKKINKWLDEHGELEAFYSISDEKELAEFIKKLASIYGE